MVMFGAWRAFIESSYIEFAAMATCGVLLIVDVVLKARAVRK